MSALSIASAFIKAHESCRLESYQDSKGVWTVGWGHTGPEVVAGLIWSQARADEQLATDIQTAETTVTKLKRRLLSDPQIAALISFSFNLGVEALATSTLLAKVNDCDFIGAAHEWVRWDHIGATELRGLLIRRFDEASLFLSGS